MSWYDVFSRFYDLSVEPYYRAQRVLSAEALDLRAGSVVVDVPCGTGLSFPHLVKGAGETGRVLGIDLSGGMAREARRTAAKMGWSRVHVHHGDATTVTLADLDAAAGAPVRPDRLHVFLGMTVFPDPEATFANLWSLLAPGGTCVVVDVHAETLTMQSHVIRWIAQADVSRRFWEPLERVARGFERKEIPSSYSHGGKMFLARGVKPG